MASATDGSGHAIPLDNDRQALSDRRYRTLWGGSKSLKTIGPGAPGLVVIVVVDVGWVDPIIAG